MIEPLDALRSQWQTATVDGKSVENVVLSRMAKSYTQTNYNYVRKCVVRRSTAIRNGDVVTIGTNKYFVTGAIPTQIKLREITATVGIYAIVPKYNASNQKTGDAEVSKATDVPCVHYSVTATMKMYDVGLLSDTVKKLLLPTVTLVKNDYRIKLDGINYWVTSVDSNEYEGLYAVQVKADNRVTK